MRVTGRPVRRLWDSNEPLDAYALVHLASAAGDALIAIALADSVFFSLPVGQARLKVALYLALTMAPLAVAGPLLAPLLDRGGYRRAISFGSSVGRALVAALAAGQADTLVLFPLAFVLLVLSKVHGLTKNSLTMAYAPAGAGLVQANGRLGRVAVFGAVTAAAPGLLLLKLGGADSVLVMAAVTYGVCALLTLRLPQPDSSLELRLRGDVAVTSLGRVPKLGLAAAGAGGLRAASGFLLFLLAFALRAGHYPTWWFAVLAGSGLAGSLLADLIAPRLPPSIREERVVLVSVLTAGAGALVAFRAFELPVLALFGLLAGMAAELGRLAFQSLMQRSAPARSQGRVFVRYETAFQLAWVGGALVPAVVAMSFRTGILVLAAFYLLIAADHVVRPAFLAARARGTR